MSKKYYGGKVEELDDRFIMTTKVKIGILRKESIQSRILLKELMTEKEITTIRGMVVASKFKSGKGM